MTFPVLQIKKQLSKKVKKKTKETERGEKENCKRNPIKNKRGFSSNTGTESFLICNKSRFQEKRIKRITHQRLRLNRDSCPPTFTE